jgi:hypothetical protein
MPGTPQAKVLALAIRMRPTLGAIGQQIADVFDPPSEENLPPQAQAAIQQLQAQLQQAQQELQALHMERAGKVLEQQTKLLAEQQKQDGENIRAMFDRVTKLEVANIGAKSQDAQARAAADSDMVNNMHDAAHDVGMQAAEHEHAQGLAAQQATLQSQTQASDQAHQQTMAQQAQQNQPQPGQ